MKRRIIFVFAVCLIVLGNSMVAAPVMSQFLPDYGYLIRVEWSVDKLTGKSDYKLIRPQHRIMEGFKVLGYGFGGFIVLWIGGFLCMAAMWSVIVRMDEPPYVSEASDLLRVHMRFTMTLLIVALGVAFLHPWFSSAEERLRASIADQDALNTAIDVYGDIVLEVFIDTFIVLIVFNVLGFFMGLGYLRASAWVGDLVGSSLEAVSIRIKNRLFTYARIDPVMVALRPSGRVDVVSFSLGWKWFGPMILGNTLVSVGRKSLVSVLLGDTRGKRLDQFRNAARSISDMTRQDAAAKAFDEVRAQTNKRAAAIGQACIAEALRSNEDRFSGESGIELARSTLRLATSRRVDKLRGHIAAEIDDRNGQMLKRFGDEVLEELRQPVYDFWKSADPGAFPSGTKFVETNMLQTVYVVEYAPQVRPVFFDRLFLLEEYPAYFRDRRGGVSQLDPVPLAFPYVVCIVSLVGSYIERFMVFYRNEPFRTRNDTLLRSNLPNTHRDCALCMVTPGRTAEAPSVVAEHALEDFWAGIFNSDLKIHNYEPGKRLDHRIRDLRGWAAASKEDPLFALSVPWQPVGVSVADIIIEMMGKTKEVMDQRFDRMVQGVLDRRRTSIGTAIRNYLYSIDPELFFEKPIEDVLRAQLEHASASFLGGLSDRLARDIDVAWIKGRLEAAIGDALVKMVSAEAEKIVADELLKLEGNVDFLSVVKELSKRKE